MSSSSLAPAGALRFLGPGWFTTVMGLAGLSLAWQRSVPLMGEAALGAALVAAAVAAGVFLALAGFSVLRWHRYPKAVEEDLRHPGRHVFFATIPLALVLLATVHVSLFGPGPLARVAWLIGSLAQLALAVWVLSRWLRPLPPSGFAWGAFTPAFLIPGVGNVVPALAGVPLGFGEWAAAQFGIGIALWIVLVVMLFVRLALHGPWMVGQLPSVFITVAPPSVIGLGVLQFGLPVAAAAAFWGVALFFLAWAATASRRMLAQEFGIGFWALSFPLTAFTSLTLRLAPDGGPLMRLAGVVTLAATSLVILGLAWATAQGLRRRQILRPEPAPVPVVQAG